MANIKRMGLLVSGGDAPGMNHTIYNILERAQLARVDCTLFRGGYRGLVQNDTISLKPEQIEPFKDKGGCAIRSSRYPEFKEKGVLKIAGRQLDALDIDNLVVIGGDGSFRGIKDLEAHTDKQLTGIPATIDNDIPSTKYSIGFDSAVTENIRLLDYDRAANYSQGRITIAEVMGRKSGEIANAVAQRGNADILIARELGLTPDQMAYSVLEQVRHLQSIGQRDITIVAVEKWLNLKDLANWIHKSTGQECRICDHSYAQRGADASEKEKEYAGRFASGVFDQPRTQRARILTINGDGHMETKGVTAALAEEKDSSHIRQIPTRTEPYKSPLMLL